MKQVNIEGKDPISIEGKDPIFYESKQQTKTAVEWFANAIKGLDTGVSYHFFQEMLEQAKEIEKQQQDDFAIGFAEWCIKKRIDFFDSTEIGETYTINGFVSKYKMSELLEIYKKEKGL